MRYRHGMRRGIYLLHLLVACGTGDEPTSSGTDTSTAASGTTDATGSTGATDASTGPTTGGTTGAATSCGCPEGQVCVQDFDFLCLEVAATCVDADGCVPGNPCTEACAVFCGDPGGMITCSDNVYCEAEIADAVHCYAM
jgi:hypothetical protein